MVLPSRDEYFALMERARALRGAEDSEKDPLADVFCLAHPEIEAEVRAFQQMPAATPMQRVARGRALESIAGLAFAGLEGLREFKSFDSAGAQYDLLVAGSPLDSAWLAVHSFLGLPEGRNDVMVEVKATAKAVDAQQVLRLSALLIQHYKDAVGLGVFVCPRGATGHPQANGNRSPSLREARLHQVLHLARTGTPIVVLDAVDLDAMSRPGGLLRRLSYRIRELQQLHGVPPARVEKRVEVDVPPHLTRAAEWLSGREKKA